MLLKNLNSIMKKLSFGRLIILLKKNILIFFIKIWNV